MKLIDIKTSSLLVDVKLNDATEKFFSLIGRKQSDYAIKIDLDKLVKYIVLMYDSKSPMIEMIDDYWSRKFEVFDMCGFRQKNGKFLDNAEDIALGHIEQVNDLIMDFLVQVAKPKWSYIIFLNESILKYTKQANDKAVNKSDVDTMTALFQKLDEAVRSWMQSNSDETNAFMDRLYYKIHKELVKIRPEAYAKRIISGDELEEDNPYGKKYKVKKPRFVGSKIPKDGE